MGTHMTRRQFVRLAGGGLAGGALLGAAGCGGESGVGGGGGTRLRLSHQWPQATGNKGDFRARITQQFAKSVADRTNGEVEIRVFPNSSLSEATEQYKAMSRGALDMTLFPVAYAAGQVPEFDITELPGMVRSHAQAANWQTAEIAPKIEEIYQRNGSKILVWNWNSVCVAVRKGDPVVVPGDIRKGSVWRGGGPRIEQVLKMAGASITSMPSSEVYSALQTGVIDALTTSPSSFRSYRMQEQTDGYTSPTDTTIAFFFEPLLIAMKQFQELPADVQKTFEEVGKGLQDFAYEASEQDDVDTEDMVRKSGDKVATINEEAFAQWEELGASVWEDFATNVQNGAELVDLARKVPAS